MTQGAIAEGGTMPKKDRPDIEALLREAAKKELTPDERREQCVSFTMGMIGKKNTMTHDDVRDRIAQMYGG